MIVQMVSLTLEGLLSFVLMNNHLHAVWSTYYTNET